MGRTSKEEIDYNASIANQLNQQQLMAATNNPDLRKKLRVDRIRKMAMGEKSAMKNATFDDPGQADWIKQRQLREIEMLRQTKKQQIISELMGNYMADSIMVHVVPGKIAFVSLKVENNTQSAQVY